MGKRLVAKRAAEKATAAEALRRVAESSTSEAQKNFALVEALFNDAKAHFTRCIESGAPTWQLRVLVGQSGIHGSHYMQAYEALDMVNWFRRLERDYLGPRSAYGGLWADLQQWAVDNELNVFWMPQADPDGVNGWYELVAWPANSLHVSQRKDFLVFESDSP